jgi:hypothetical protein
VKPPGEFASRLAPEATDHDERSELRHRQLDIHEETSGLIGEGVMAKEQARDRADLIHLVDFFHRRLEVTKSLD